MHVFRQALWPAYRVHSCCRRNLKTPLLEFCLSNSIYGYDRWTINIIELVKILFSSSLHLQAYICFMCYIGPMLHSRFIGFASISTESQFVFSVIFYRTYRPSFVLFDKWSRKKANAYLKCEIAKSTWNRSQFNVLYNFKQAFRITLISDYLNSKTLLSDGFFFSFDGKFLDYFR